MGGEQLMSIYNEQAISRSEIRDLCTRSTDPMVDVTEIINGVREDGDSALKAYTLEYDKVDLEEFELGSKTKLDLLNGIDPRVRNAFEQAAENIKKFHEAQKRDDVVIETMPGVSCYSRQVPIEKVGLYVPGGSAPLPSTALMLGIPAKIAGCDEISIVTPPGKDGKINQNIVLAASLCGIDRIYTLGGAQAIAALAYGTESIAKVDKIFGPGNEYVTAAKMQVSIDPEGASIDIPAGPSEVLVIADDQAQANFVASDLLAQAEHDASSRAILVCTDHKKARDVLAEIERQAKLLPRKEQINGALSASFVLIVDSTKKAIEFANIYAPEHLIINTSDAEELSTRVKNAGSVFIGPYSCESAGDYGSGPNHCLPTLGYARSIGGVSLSSFQKQITFQRVTKEGAGLLAPFVTCMAEQEGLDAHKNAMAIRTI